LRFVPYARMLVVGEPSDLAAGEVTERKNQREKETSKSPTADSTSRVLLETRKKPHLVLYPVSSFEFQLPTDFRYIGSISVE